MKPRSASTTSIAIARRKPSRSRAAAARRCRARAISVAAPMTASPAARATKRTSRARSALATRQPIELQRRGDDRPGQTYAASPAASPLRGTRSSPVDEALVLARSLERGGSRGEREERPADHARDAARRVDPQRPERSGRGRPCEGARENEAPERRHARLAAPANRSPTTPPRSARRAPRPRRPWPARTHRVPRPRARPSRPRRRPRDARLRRGADGRQPLEHPLRTHRRCPR